jgi:glycine/D-amino acid oxidase-like deaminating enzyme
VTQIGEHAVVLGGNLAGLAGAAVLAQRFERVTIVERDCPPPTGRNRKGVPQGRHVHVLLPGGLRGLAELFPGVREDLRERGAHVFDARALRLNIAGGSLLLEDADAQSIGSARLPPDVGQQEDMGRRRGIRHRPRREQCPAITRPADLPRQTTVRGRHTSERRAWT